MALPALEHLAVSQQLIHPWLFLATPQPAHIVVKRGLVVVAVVAAAKKAVVAGINTVKEGGGMGIAIGMEMDIAIVTEMGIAIPAVADTVRAVMVVKGGEIVMGGGRVPGTVKEKERAHETGKTAGETALETVEEKAEMEEKAGKRAHEMATVVRRNPEIMGKVKHLLYQIHPNARRADGTVKVPVWNWLVLLRALHLCSCIFCLLLVDMKSQTEC